MLPGLFSFSVSIRPWSSVSLVSPWPAPLSCFPVVTGSPAGSSGVSKPYLRRNDMPFLGLAFSAPSECLFWVPALFSSAAVPAVDLVAAPSPARASFPCCRRWIRYHWLIGWWGGFRPLPVPVRPPQALPLPQFPLRGFLPPNATHQRRGCRCPVTT